MPRTVVTRLLCAALAAALVAVAGCGGNDPDPKAELATAFSPQGIGELKSGNLDAELTLGVSEGGDPAKELKLALTGPFSNGTADLTATARGRDPRSGDPVSFQGGLTVTSDNLFIDYGGTEYELGSQRFAELKAAQAQSRPSSAPPTDFKSGCRTALEQTGGDASVCDKLKPSNWVPKLSFDGTEDVGGTKTDHFSGDIDVDRFFSDLLDVGLQAVPPAERAQVPRDLIEQFAGFIESAGVDVYVGTDDNIPRRAQFAMKISVLGEDVNLGVDAQVNDANQPQTITAPTGAVPIEQLRDRLPVGLQGAFDCFLGAHSAADFTACGSQVSSSGAAVSGTQL
jgi:hypothetical protein